MMMKKANDAVAFFRTGRHLAKYLLCACIFSALAPSSRGGETTGENVDAVTAASVDAATGASKQLEPIAVSGDFSVAYAVNDDGALFILARDLTDAYRRDELASDSLFSGKAVIVKGEVEKTSKADAPKPWLTLSGDDDSGKKVRCSLKPGQLPGGDIVGKTVQIRGRCDGMKLSVSVADGEIID